MTFEEFKCKLRARTDADGYISEGYSLCIDR